MSLVTQQNLLKKELGLRDLVLTQIVFVVGTSWVGTAAKLGPSQTVYWLLAILLFYLPVAAVVIYLIKLMPLEGGLYQWAKFGFNDFTGFMVAWNLWLLGIVVMAGTGLVIATQLFYAIGPSAAWMPGNRIFVSALNGALIAVLILVTIRGLSLGKWVHNVGAILLLVTYCALIALPFFARAAGKLPQYRPVEWAMPAATLFSLNIFSKMALGALSGFEYVAILAGETRAPVRNIGRSVIIAAPIIALMFILGTSSVMAYVKFGDIDLIGPVPQALSIGAREFGIGSVVASIAILMLAGRAIALLSIYFTGNTRLPMVAGWDHILPDVVYAPATALQNADQLHHLCRHRDSSLCRGKPARGWRAGSISTHRQCGRNLLRHRLSGPFRHSDIWFAKAFLARAALAESSRCGRRADHAFIHRAHDFSDRRSPEPLLFCRQDHCCHCCGEFARRIDFHSRRTSPPANRFRHFIGNAASAVTFARLILSDKLLVRSSSIRIILTKISPI